MPNYLLVTHKSQIKAFDGLFDCGCYIIDFLPKGQWKVLSIGFIVKITYTIIVWTSYPTTTKLDQYDLLYNSVRCIVSIYLYKQPDNYVMLKTNQSEIASSKAAWETKSCAKKKNPDRNYDSRFSSSNTRSERYILVKYLYPVIYWRL